MTLILDELDSHLFKCVDIIQDAVDPTDSSWSLVADYDPEYQSHAEWLEEHSTRLIFSKNDV
jgi:hypothetical protein